jgi:hypothetical protein
LKSEAQKSSEEEVPVAKRLVEYFNRIEVRCMLAEESPNATDFRDVIGSSKIADSIKKGGMNHMLKHYYRAIKYYAHFDPYLNESASMILAWLLLLLDLVENRKAIGKQVDYIDWM